MSLGPTFTFTIPSIYDDIDLDCRIYNPPHSVLLPNANGPTWRSRGAIVAHPYAPLGGCYDDMVVLAAVEECLRKGFVVGTFNFRGVGGSKGSTSWTGKGELDDYISFAGLLIHYLQTLQRAPSPSYIPSRAPSDTHLTPVPSNTLPPHPGIPPATIAQPQQPIRLLLAGYSYGSLITTHLPQTPQLLHHFANPQLGSAQAEILARADSLGTQTVKDAQLHSEARRGRPLGSLAYAMGGEEGEPGSRRVSRDGGGSRKSIDAVRRSVDRSRRRLLKRQGSSAAGNEEEAPELEPEGVQQQQQQQQQQTSAVSPGPLQPEDLPIEIFYLLISPLLPPIASLATLHLSSLFKHHKSPPHQPATETEAKFLANPTYVIYGAADFFTSSKKLRKWCGGLQRMVAVDGDGAKEAGGGKFQWREVGGAGHFWREEGVEGTLRACVGAWLDGVVLRNGGEEGGKQGN